MTSDWPIVIGLLTLIGFGLAAIPFRRVSRHRVDRFARRHQLTVTAGNGPIILRYLATTSAWRSAGLLLAGGVTLYDAWLRGEGVELDYVSVFAGWFVGAIVAEWRIERMATNGPRRSAALVPRRIGDYLALWVLCLPIAVFALVLAVEFVGLVNAPRHRDELAAWLLVTAVSSVSIVIVSRHVLARPQPMAAPDVIAADEARRAASLRVLAGSAIAIGGYLLVGVAGLQLRPVWLWETWQPLVTTFAALLLPLLGAAAAILSRPYQTRRLGAAA
jgi:hypothetical protein